MADHEKVDALLRRFPGPVTLGVNRVAVLGYVLGALCFVALGLTLIFFDRHLTAVVVGWLNVAFFAGGSLFFVAMLLPRAGSLTLTADGFTLWSLFRKDEVSWHQIIYLGGSDQYLRFSYEESGGAAAARNQTAWQDDDRDDDNIDEDPSEAAEKLTPCTHSKQHSSSAGWRMINRKARVFGNFGLSSPELIRLMQVWFEYAVYAPPFPIALPSGGGPIAHVSQPPNNGQTGDSPPPRTGGM